MQDYKHHIRFYPAHHFIFYPVLLSAIGVCGYLAITAENTERLLWIALAAAFFAITWLSFLLRQHYALYNQNRIVRLEMRFRYYALTHQRLEPLESKLSFSQIAALRFASDEELPALVQRTLTENLSSDAIKKSIRVWLPDYMRV